jgi:hypothetical protein
MMGEHGKITPGKTAPVPKPWVNPDDLTKAWEDDDNHTTYRFNSSDVYITIHNVTKKIVNITEAGG